MKEKIGKGLLTTEHPASSYGLPVLVLDGVAYGPDDFIQPNVMAGDAIVSADDITMQIPSAALLMAAIAFVRQSPENRDRWEFTLRRDREHILAASALGRKGGKVTSEAKTKANREKANLPPKAGKQSRGRPLSWVVVVAYDYPGHERGEVISRHATPFAAEKAAKRSGRNSFLAIKHKNDL